MEPLVSIIIPAYNRAGTIMTALESIQAQTYQNWEAIVVDDGSTDATPEIVTAIACRDKRVSLVKQGQNRGAQAARNAGIRSAKGEWIAFLDSDDKYLPESLRIRMDLAKQERAFVVHTRGYIVHEKEPMKVYELPAMKGRVYKKLLTRDGPMFQSLLIRKEALATVGYLDETVTSFQEWDTSIRLAKAYPFSFTPVPTYIYDYRTPGAMSRSALRNAKGYEQVFRKHWVDILRYAGPSVLWRHYKIAADWYGKANQKYDTVRCKLNGLAWACLCPVKVFSKIRRFITCSKRGQ